MAKHRWNGRRRVMSKSDAITGLVGNSTRKERGWNHDLADIMKTYGSEGARERLGVSKTTWRRWQSGKQHPSAGNLSKIRGEWNTPAVRRKTVAPRRASKATSNGANVKVSGQVGPYAAYSPGGSDEPRDRTIDFDLSGEQMRELYDAYVYDGPDAAHEVLQHFAAVEYFETGWQHDPAFEDDPDAQAYIDDLTEIVFDSFDEISEDEASEYDTFDE